MKKNICKDYRVILLSRVCNLTAFKLTEQKHLKEDPARNNLFFFLFDSSNDCSMSPYLKIKI